MRVNVITTVIAAKTKNSLAISRYSQLSHYVHTDKEEENEENKQTEGKIAWPNSGENHYEESKPIAMTCFQNKEKGEKDA